MNTGAAAIRAAWLRPSVRREFAQPGVNLASARVGNGRLDAGAGHAENRAPPARPGRPRPKEATLR